MKITDFKYTLDDIITTDGYLNFCNDNGICYIKTDFFYTGKFNWRGQEHPKFIDKVCVIGHSDYPITDQISTNFEKVFCINRDTDLENTFGLPLGITNYTDESLLHKIYGDRNAMLEVFDKSVIQQNLAYINFNINTFHDRKNILNQFSNKSWIMYGQINNTLEGRKKYLEEIKSSKFVFCPRGNGIDTHRLWETLYMGSIPIVKHHRTHHLLHDLPILFIHDWSEINQEFLESKYIEFMNKDWNFDKLKISYWENLILKNI